MSGPSVSIRELKSRLSHYLRLAKAGQAVVITERGTPIGRIVPASLPVEGRIEAMARSGLLAWDGGRLEPLEPVASVHRGASIADLLVEDRG